MWMDALSPAHEGGVFGGDDGFGFLHVEGHKQLILHRFRDPLQKFFVHLACAGMRRRGFASCVRICTWVFMEMKLLR